MQLFSQMHYLGLASESNVRMAQVELENSGVYWPKSKLIGDSLYVCTKTGVYVKDIVNTLNDTIWYQYAFNDIPIRTFEKKNDSLLAITAKISDSLLLYSNDNGLTYFNRTSTFFFNYLPVNTIWDIDLKPNYNNSLIALHENYGVAESTDFGLTWSELNPLGGGYQERFVSYHPLDSEAIYYSGETSFFSSYIYMSLDSGTNWSLTGDYHNHATHLLNFDPTNENIIISGNEGIIRKSYNKGITWHEKATIPIYIYGIVRDNNDPTVLYATGDYHGVNETIEIYRSIDNGENWNLFYDLYLPNADGVVDLHFYNNKLYLYTMTNGIFMLDLNLLNLNEQELNAKTSIFPNPTTGIIEFENPEIIDSIEVFDINGRLILVGQENNTASQIDLSNFDDGFYFVRITSYGKSILRKVIKN